MRDPCLRAGVPSCFNNKDDSDDSGGHHGDGHHDDRGDDGGGHHGDSRHYDRGGHHGHGHHDGGRQGLAGRVQPSRTLTVTVNLGFRATWRVGPTRRCRAGR